MTKTITRPRLYLSLAVAATMGLLTWSGQETRLEASSHREAPLIADDPVADNTDLYAFRDPNDAEKINIIANYIPFQLPQGGPNYYNFGENVRYEIHVNNGSGRNRKARSKFNKGKATSNADDLTFRFTFTRINEDPTTFFKIRLGKENLKATYTCEVSRDGGNTFTNLVTNGVVPPYNVGPRSIEGPAGLNTDYNTLMAGAVQTVGDNIKIFAGPVDDPFFADLGAIFDLGGNRPENPRDGLFRKNVHTIALQIPIAQLQKDGKTGEQAANILDGDYVIGVWASASRPALRVLTPEGQQLHLGTWVQVSRIGMPLTNEVINPIGVKDAWNARTPYTEVAATEEYLSNPELGLYMAEGPGYFGDAVPGLSALRVQRNSLGSFDFANGKEGVSALLGADDATVAGTAFAKVANGGFAEYLLRPGKPRSVDILPIFHTGVPNLPPYQLAAGKPDGQPLAPGKPFVNNFLPLINGNPLAGGSVGGDMLRLNMAVPTTPRNSPEFSSEGLLAAAVLGLTDPRFNTTTELQAIPNMDGFPNGRRLEDDVTRIELQAVGGVVLAAIGLPYETANGLTNVLTFTTGVEANDIAFKTEFPYVQTPWRGTEAQDNEIQNNATTPGGTGNLKQQSSAGLKQSSSTGLNLKPTTVERAQNYPNPFTNETTFRYTVNVKAPLSIFITDMKGRRVATVMKEKMHTPGTYDLNWRPDNLGTGIYIATFVTSGTVLQSVRLEHK